MKTNTNLLEAAEKLGAVALSHTAGAIPALKRPDRRRDLMDGIRTEPHSFDRATVRALLSGNDTDEALVWVDRHKENPSFLNHALSLEKGRMWQRNRVIDAIKTAIRSLEIGAFDQPAPPTDPQPNTEVQP